MRLLALWSTSRMSLPGKCSQLYQVRYYASSACSELHKLMYTHTHTPHAHAHTHTSHPVLQMFLTSSKPTIRFSAVKTLNRIAMVHPDAVTSCNVDLENLITDNNRSIATLAITTLLKVPLIFTPSLYSSWCSVLKLNIRPNYRLLKQNQSA